MTGFYLIGTFVMKELNNNNKTKINKLNVLEVKTDTETAFKWFGSEAATRVVL